MDLTVSEGLESMHTMVGICQGHGTGAVVESIHLETQPQGRENDAGNGFSLLKPQIKIVPPNSS